MTPTEFHDRIRPILLRYRASVTSGLRSHARNKEKGGHLQSKHLSDQAVDVVLDDWQQEKDFITDLQTEAGVWAEREDHHTENDHIHIQVP